MKYRIKNETERKLINALLGISEFESEFQDNSLTIRVSFAGNDFGVWFFETEPVQELAEGWHPFPQTKPQKAGRYLVALKCNDDGERNVVDAANFAENCFDAWHSESGIIAWREMPKIWKEQG